MLDFLKRKKKDKKPREKKGFFRELLNDILFALVAVTIIRGLFIEAYAIPTGSMENSMLIGDHLFVSKLHYGARTPRTLIQFPLAHQTFWGIKVGGKEIPSYSDAIQLPSYRLPGIRSVRRGEPVVFNYPPELNYPVDIKTFYVKRCMAIPGDTLELRNKQIYIDGEAVENPPNMQTSYVVNTERGVSKTIMRKIGITDFRPSDGRGGALAGWFQMHTTAEQAEELAKVNGVKSVTEEFEAPAEGMAFPEKRSYIASEYTSYDPVTEFGWSVDEFGPLVMPEEGMTIPLTQKNIDLYRTIIEHYEDNDDVVIDSASVSIEGETITEYTFKQGYYYMIGDNRHNSEDSRTWGFVPADHIVGKPLFIFWSVDSTDPDAGFFSRIRWNRIFDLIK
jgi:signal peptidase I